jgi:TonB family protein
MSRPRTPRPPDALAQLAAVVAALLAIPDRPAAAQELLGRVVEAPSGRAIGGVGVRLYRVVTAPPGAPAASADSAATEAAPIRTVVTAADGGFALFPPGPGTYRVRVGAGALAPAVTVAADSSDQRLYVVPLDYEAPLYPAQVDRAARSVPGSVDLRYPNIQFRANVTGCAAVELVVDTLGRAERHSVRPVAATQPAFARWGMDAVAKAKFTPAVRDGRPVRAVVVIPLVFEIVGQRVVDRSPCEVAGGIAEEAIVVRAGYAAPPSIAP